MSTYEPCDVCHVPTFIGVLEIKSDFEGLRTCGNCEMDLAEKRTLNPEEWHQNNLNEFIRELDL